MLLKNALLGDDFVLDNFIKSFDFDWSDMYNDESVRFQTLEQEQGRQKLLIGMNSAISFIIFCFIQSIGL